MNFIAPFDFGKETISSCLGRVMEWSNKDLGILNAAFYELKREFLLLSLSFIIFFILCQQFILIFDSTTTKK